MRPASTKAGSASAGTDEAMAYPLLQTVVFALANMGMAYISLFKVPPCNSSSAATAAAATATTPVLPALPTTLAAVFGAQTVFGLARYFLSVSSSSSTATRKKSSANRRLVRVLITSWGILLAGTAICHVFAVFFGAGLKFKAQETLMLSLYLSLLSFYPASFVLGYDLDRWLQVFIHYSPTTYTEAGLYCQGWMTIFGAWLGSIVIPLDWDRPWQEWPVPCILGAFGFYMIGTLVGVVVTVVMRQRAVRREFGIVDRKKLQNKPKRS